MDEISQPSWSGRQNSWVLYLCYHLLTTNTMTQVLSLSPVFKKLRHRESNLFKTTLLAGEHREWGCRIYTFTIKSCINQHLKFKFPSWTATADGPDIVTGSQQFTIGATHSHATPPISARDRSPSGTLILLVGASVGVTLGLISPCSFCVAQGLDKELLSSSPSPVHTKKGRNA